MTKLRGAFTALVTPMHEDESVDYEGFRSLVKSQCEGGIDGILPLGTTAETPTLTEDEEKEYEIDYLFSSASYFNLCPLFFLEPGHPQKITVTTSAD